MVGEIKMKKTLIIMVAILLIFAISYFYMHKTNKKIPDSADLVFKGGGNPMAVVKVLNVVGDSTVSWEDAIHKAVEEAAKTIDNISGIEVVNQTANVKNGKIVEYKANIQIAYRADQGLD
ncbi:dodecin family protein [Thermoanaerobacter mathranii]